MMFKRIGAVGVVGVAAFLLGSGVSFIFAAWENPTVTPPGGNVEAPINVGSVLQHKAGGLSVAGNNSVLNSSGTLTVAGDAKLGKDLEVTGVAKVGQTLMSSLIVAGPPAGAATDVRLSVGGKVQIRGGNPVQNYVLTATGSDGTAEWKPAPVTKIKAGSNVTLDPASGTGEVTVNSVGGVTRLRAGSNISLSQETGEVTVNASFSDNTPYWVNNIPYPPGGGKILYSNSEGSMSWGDPPSTKSDDSGTVCGGGRYTGGSVTSPDSVWGCAYSKHKGPSGAACREGNMVDVAGGWLCIR